MCPQIVFNNALSARRACSPGTNGNRALRAENLSIRDRDCPGRQRCVANIDCKDGGFGASCVQSFCIDSPLRQRASQPYAFAPSGKKGEEDGHDKEDKEDNEIDEEDEEEEDEEEGDDENMPSALFIVRAHGYTRINEDAGNGT